MIYNDQGLAVFSPQEVTLLEEALSSSIQHDPRYPLRAEFQALLHKMLCQPKAREVEEQTDQAMGYLFNDVEVTFRANPCFSPEEFPAGQFTAIAEQVMIGFVGSPLTEDSAYEICAELVKQLQGFVHLNGIPLAMTEGPRWMQVTVEVWSLKTRYVAEFQGYRADACYYRENMRDAK